MNRFNLTFSGEILAGENPEQVKLRFADMFAIDDRARLDRFFSGETIILRRNLERKDAAQFYHELQLLGAVAALVKVTTSDLADDTSKTPPPKLPVKGRKKALLRSTSNPPPEPQNKTDAAAEIKSRKLEAQRLASEKKAREKAAVEARQRKMAEEEAREQAEAAANLRLAEQERAQKAAEQARLAAEETAIRDAKIAELKRLEEEEAARKRALKAESKRKAAEEAAQRKAKRIQEKAEKARRKAEEAARRKAEFEEQKRLAAEEEARRKAELEEQKRLAAEEEARRQAELEEQKRLAAEEEARRKAELEKQKRLAAKEEARRKAELEEQKRLAAEEEARLKAELEAQRRLAAEKAALRKAELDKQKRLAAEKEVRLKTELEQRKRQKAEKKARRKAALDKKKRLAAETEARRLAELEEKRRLAADDIAGRAAAQAKEAARLEAELEAKAREAAAQAEPIKAAAQKQPPNLPPSESSQRSTEQKPVTLRTQQGPQKAAKARVKTTLDVPLRKRGQTPEVGAPGQRKRQSGEPNLYKLRPFRNSQAVRTRALHARHRMRQAYTVGVLALAILLICGGSFLQNATYPVITGASAVAINTHSEPLLLAGNSLLFHDRAGVSTTEDALNSLGIAALKPPLAFDNEGALIALGRMSNEAANPADRDVLSLLRCDLAHPMCEQLSPQLLDNNIDAFVINPLDGSLLIADRAAGKLLKVDSEGAIVASAAVAIPVDPVLRLHGGLLLMNSAEGPAISVFRYENSAFGKQLDEILLLPPAGQQLEASRVGGFIYSGNAWWVNLRDQTSGSGELHRFDEDWNYLDTAPLASDTGPVQLVAWGEKTLVNNPRHPVIQRFNAQGLAEAPFASTLLQDLIDGQQQRASLLSIAWHGGLLVCTLAVVLSFGFGYLHGIRGLVYRPRREQGAEPLDDHAATLRWIEPAQNRQLQLRRTGLFYGLGVLGALLLAIALNVSAWQLAALLLALSGPAVALLLLSRQAVGHIGIQGDRLILVDHSGLYHLAAGPRLHYRGPFLSIDDIVVFCGSRLLPAFSPTPLQQHIRPPALGAIKVDYKTIAIKLLESRHPIALGALAIATGAAAAALLLLLRDIF